ncbi:hypothetical protein CR513_28045, partial [Mucuna pruriens]
EGTWWVRKDIPNEDTLENKFYVEQEQPFDHCPESMVKDEELEEWSSSWHKSLVVHLLGKKAKSGSIQIIDMSKNYYIKHPLLEGPWMIADKYLLVDRWSPFLLASVLGATKVAT